MKGPEMTTRQIQLMIEEQCTGLPELTKVKEEVKSLENGINGGERVEGNVVIVGAGITGLVAAMLLEDIGVNVTILEASSRPGGRVQTYRKDDWFVEFGAMRI